MNSVPFQRRPGQPRVRDRTALDLSLRLVLAMLLGWSLLAGSAAAQPVPVPGGTLEGRVTDPGRAAVAGASVTIWGPVKRDLRSGADGDYRFTGLPPGSYRVTASHPGFMSVESLVQVAAGGRTDAPLVLTLSFGEDVVVTAARVETSLADAPATMSVVDGKTIELTPAQTLPDLLRTVPGLNVVQTSPRDVNLTARQSSAFLAPSQLTLVDGRPLYFDFFNVVFWDLISVGTPDIDRIEVVRGPAATMWGANAVTGVVNVLTKPPRQTPGLQLTLTGGLFGQGKEETGGLFGVAARYAGTLSDRLSYRVSAGYLHSDSFERPQGSVRVSTSPLDPTLTVGGGSYDAVAYANNGTAQPHVDLRVDQELGDGGLLSYSGGLAGTEGIIQTPIGPFDIESGSKLGYGRVAYTNGGFRLAAFANLLTGTAPSLVTRDATGRPIFIDFKNNSYDLDAGYTRLLGSRHLVSVGANFRYSTFDLSIAPGAEDRSQVGFYLTDEVDLGRVHASVGARVDKFQNLSSADFSPRVVVSYTPWNGQTFRASYNRAFRAPSAIENSLDISVVGGSFPLGSIDPRLGNAQLPIVTRTVGNPDLEAETHDAFEVAYTGTLAKTRLDVAFYWNQADHVISTTPGPTALLSQGIQPFYTSQNPPAGWPFPPVLIDVLAQRGIVLPSYVKTLNLGRVRNRGVEVSLTHELRPRVTVFGSYSYQATPTLPDSTSDPLRPPADIISVAPRNRVSFGLNYSGDVWLGSLAFHQVDRAFWTQVLSPAYYGYSPSYVLLNAALGRRWAGGRLTTSLKATNLLDDNAQQHVFGDVLRRTVVAEIQMSF